MIGYARCPLAGTHELDSADTLAVTLLPLMRLNQAKPKYWKTTRGAERGLGMLAAG
jgi:hypothetical protein